MQPLFHVGFFGGKEEGAENEANLSFMRSEKVFTAFRFKRRRSPLETHALGILLLLFRVISAPFRFMAADDSRRQGCH